MNKIIIYSCLFTFSLLGQNLFGQITLPVLKANNAVLSIKDGGVFLENYWTISPEIELDVYVADKTNAAKVVTFYSDIDSISFTVKPTEKYDFLILLNEKDSCFTQIKSGISPLVIGEVKPKSDTIPFTLTQYNNLSISTILNEKDTVNLMYHTASSAVFLTKKAVTRLSANTIDLDKTTSLNSWGGESTARYSRNNTLRIGALSWDNITITEDEHSGRLTDGKFGNNLFQNKVIEIDYNNSLLIIHNSLPEIKEDYEQLNLVFKRGSMYLEGSIKIGAKEYKNEFLIHSGFSGTLLLDDAFVKKHDIMAQLEQIGESELKDSFGNVLKTKKMLLPEVQFGETIFSAVPIGLFEGALGRQHISVFGGDMLKRFNLIFDLQQAHIYLKPNGLFHAAFVG